MSIIHDAFFDPRAAEVDAPQILIDILTLKQVTASVVLEVSTSSRLAELLPLQTSNRHSFRKKKP